MHTDLVYDVGFHNGDDSAYYLHRGFRVVAVEADPDLIAAGRRRFAEQIAAGRLSLIHAGIRECEDPAPFYLCNGKSEFNSFDRANATKFGHTCRAIEIPCRRFKSLLRDFGTPHYLKIDIEGCDQHCVADLDRNDLPLYISCELSTTDQILGLAEIGYVNFKLVWQGRHHPVHDRTRTLSAWADKQIQRIPPLSWIGAKVHSLGYRSKRVSIKLMRRCGVLPAENPWDWKFPHGSSGPFGQDAPGEWIDLDETLFRWLALRRSHGDNFWVDVHAWQQGIAKPLAIQSELNHRRCA